MNSLKYEVILVINYILRNLLTFIFNYSYKDKTYKFIQWQFLFFISALYS